MKELNFQWKMLEEFTTEEMFTLFQLRQKIFVVEQDCVYLDMDDIDRSSFHLIGQEYGTKQVIATLRIYSEGKTVWHIGRVAVSIDHRKNGVALMMLKIALVTLKEKGAKCVEISAQEYLVAFYESLGFESSSEPYMLDGLPHLDMIRHI
ncbi:GNAT family N-acetyltransferase [Prolixibacteraceae bacterium]|nr:GNAT family N-acetyltransferase [Prolixibacteraceae bacterium]